jgi:hypothetical protein
MLHPQQIAAFLLTIPPTLHPPPASALSPAVSQQATVGYTPRKVALFVEPSPFSHISGMKNRFESLIKTLREAGDEVMVVTPDPTPPKEFCGAQVCVGCISREARGGGGAAMQALAQKRVGEAWQAAADRWVAVSCQQIWGCIWQKGGDWRQQ